MKNTKLHSVRVATALVLAVSSSQMLSTAAFATNRTNTTNTPVACTTADVQINSRNADLSQVVVALKSSATQKNVTCDVSLNSYKTDGPTWPTSGIQALIDHKTVTLTKANPTAALAVQTAPCFGQNDLYLGSQRFDGVDGALPQYPNGVFPTKLITAWNGGKACAETVTPPTVTFNDVCGNDKDKYTIPTTKGIDYQINGKTVAAGTYNGTGTVTVTAVAKSGYVLATNAKTSWTLTFTSEACPVPPKHDCDKPETPTTPTTPTTPKTPETPVTTPQVTPETPHILAVSTTAPAPAALPATGSSTNTIVLLASAAAAFAFGAASLVRAKLSTDRNQ